MSDVTYKFEFTPDETNDLFDRLMDLTGPKVSLRTHLPLVVKIQNAIAQQNRTRQAPPALASAPEAPALAPAEQPAPAL